jgi:hypothetical protein
MENYKSLGQKRVDDAAFRTTKQQAAVDGKVLGELTKVFNKLPSFDPNSPQGQAMSDKFEELTGVPLPEIAPNTRVKFHEDAETGRHYITYVDPRGRTVENQPILKADGTPLIAKSPQVYSTETRAETEADKLKWNKEKFYHEQTAKEMLETKRQEIKQVVNNDQIVSRIIQDVIKITPQKHFGYRLAMMDGNSAEAQRILNQEVALALQAYRGSAPAGGSTQTTTTTTTKR